MARRRPPRAMRPHPAVRIARVTVPAELVRRLVGMAGAITPADNPRVAYHAAFGLKPDTIRIYRAVCRRYPQVKPLVACAPRGLPRRRSCSRHMISDSTAGWAIAKLVATATRLGVSEVIYRRTSGTCSGFGGLASDVDRGSPTAKQMDMCMYSVCCDSGTA